MALIDINVLIPGDWEKLSAEVSRLFETRYAPGKRLPAIDISKIAIPPAVRMQLREANLKKIHAINPLPPADLMNKIANVSNLADGSDERKDLFTQLSEWSLEDTFDEKILELIDRSSEEYQPYEFISQLVELIVQFLNQGACFRTGGVIDSLDLAQASQSILIIKQAWEGSTDIEAIRLLELLTCDLTNGGDTPWFSQLPNPLKTFAQGAIAEHT